MEPVTKLWKAKSLESFIQGNEIPFCCTPQHTNSSSYCGDLSTSASDSTSTTVSPTDSLFAVSPFTVSPINSPIESRMGHKRCPNIDYGCEYFIPEEYVEDHLNECQYAEVSCAYESIGCKVRMLRKDIKKHEVNDNTSHLHLHLDAYFHFIKTKESLDLLVLKLLFLGPPRLGKTTVRRRLLKLIIDLKSSGEENKSHPSTGTLESSDVVVTKVSSTTAVLTETEWFMLENLSDEARMLIFSLLDTIQNSSTTATNESESKNVTNNTEEILPSESSDQPLPVSTIQQNSQQPTILSSSTSGITQETRLPQHVSEATALFKTAIDAEQWNDLKHNFQTYLRMEDTGGQPELMDMLPALTLGPGLYLLFINLQNDLDHRYKLTYCNSSGESTPPVQSVYSVKEMLLSSLSSISCFNSSSPISRLSKPRSDIENFPECSKSVAYIVGTHKDKVSRKRIKTLNEDLKKVITPTQFYKKDIIQFASQEDVIISIDNMEGGAEEVEEVKRILKTAMERHFKKLKIPAVWLFFSLFLRRRDKKIAQLGECIQLSHDLGMSDHETKVALWFLHHHAGVLMYFPNVSELKDLVILDVQIVYDSVTALIINAMTFDKIGHSDAEDFKKTGKFAERHIFAATNEVSGDYIPGSKLIALLEFLHIIARISSDDCSPISPTSKDDVNYIMPCMLKNATIEELDSISRKPQMVPSLKMHFVCGFVPIGVFPSLIACFIANKSFKLIQNGIRKNIIQFCFGDFYTLLTLVCRPTHYECIIFNFRTPKAIPHVECNSIRKEIEATFKAVSSRMNYGFIMDYEFAFDCPLHTDTDEKHLCAIRNVNTGLMICLRSSNDIEPVDIPAENMVWYGQPQAMSPSELSTGSTSTHSSPQDSKVSITCKSIKELFHHHDFPSSYAEKLGSYLNISWAKLQEMSYDNRGSCDVFMSRVIDYWLNNDENKSWIKLADAVDKCGCKILAEILQAKH